MANISLIRLVDPDSEHVKNAVDEIIFNEQKYGRTTDITPTSIKVISAGKATYSYIQQSMIFEAAVVILGNICVARNIFERAPITIQKKKLGEERHLSRF